MENSTVGVTSGWGMEIGKESRSIENWNGMQRLEKWPQEPGRRLASKCDPSYIRQDAAPASAASVTGWHLSRELN